MCYRCTQIQSCVTVVHALRTYVVQLNTHQDVCDTVVHTPRRMLCSCTHIKTYSCIHQAVCVTVVYTPRRMWYSYTHTKTYILQLYTHRDVCGTVVHTSWRMCCRCTQIKTYSWDNAQVVLVGNKCDLDDERVVSTDRGRQLSQQMGL